MSITIDGVALAMAVTAMAVAFYGPLLARSQDNQRAAILGSELSIAGQAAGLFVAGNIGPLLAAVPSGQYAQVPWSDLLNGGSVNGQGVTGGYTAPGDSPTNSRGQAYALCIEHTPAGGLAAWVVTSGGMALGNPLLGPAAMGANSAQAGSLDSLSGAIAHGVQGAWSADLTGCAGAGVPVAAGHLVWQVSSGAATTSASSGTWLSRQNVPGNAAMTTMSTSIDMAGNDIDNVGPAQSAAVNGGRSWHVSEGVSYTTEIASGSTVPAITCATGQTPILMAWPGDWRSDTPVSSVWRSITPTGSGWTIQLYGYDASGTAVPLTGNVEVIQKCNG